MLPSNSIHNTFDPSYKVNCEPAVDTKWFNITKSRDNNFIESLRYLQKTTRDKRSVFIMNRDDEQQKKLNETAKQFYILVF